MRSDGRFILKLKLKDFKMPNIPIFPGTVRSGIRPDFVPSGWSPTDEDPPIYVNGEFNDLSLGDVSIATVSTTTAASVDGFSEETSNSANVDVKAALSSTSNGSKPSFMTHPNKILTSKSGVNYALAYYQLTSVIPLTTEDTLYLENISGPASDVNMTHKVGCTFQTIDGKYIQIRHDEAAGNFELLYNGGSNNYGTGTTLGFQDNRRWRRFRAKLNMSTKILDAYFDLWNGSDWTTKSWSKTGIDVSSIIAGWTSDINRIQAYNTCTTANHGTLGIEWVGFSTVNWPSETV